MMKGFQKKNPVQQHGIQRKHDQVQMLLIVFRLMIHEIDCSRQRRSQHQKPQHQIPQSKSRRANTLRL